MVYRVFFLSGIVLTIADMAFFVGVLLALGSLFMWLCLPLFKFIRYLAVNPELARVRMRAVATTCAFFAVMVALVGVIPFPDRFRIEGVVEAESFFHVHAGSDGFLTSVLASETPVSPGGILATLKNPSLEVEWRVLLAKEKELQAKIRLAEATDPAEALSVREQYAALAEEKERVAALREKLRVAPAMGGLWVAPRLSDNIGKYIKIGDSLGQVLSMDNLIIRSVPGQDAAVSLVAEAKALVDLRMKGRADLETSARIMAVMPAGRKELPSAALGFPAGGETAVDMQDQRGMTPDEHVFEIKLSIDRPPWRLLPGQVVVIRFDAADKPLLLQGWRALQQLLQRRFHV